MQKKSLIILIVLLVMGSVITALYMWNKPKRTASDEEATATLTASELYAAYTADAGAANIKFLDKVIIVSGQVVSLDTSDKGITTVTLETADLFVQSRQ
jgi:flagellar basal body-associated protein FliL